MKRWMELVLTGSLMVGLAMPSLAAAEGPLPDLSLVSWGFGYNADCSEIFSINAFVENAGDADAGRFPVVFLLDGRKLGARRVPGVDVGEVVITPPFDRELPGPQPGVHDFEVRLDPFNFVAESNEDNNTGQSSFSC